jgi:hypothetical protein
MKVSEIFCVIRVDYDVMQGTEYFVSLQRRFLFAQKCYFWMIGRNSLVPQNI